MFKKLKSGVGRKAIVQFSVKSTVARRIEHYAWKAGIMTHTLIENAIEFALDHGLDPRELQQDKLIQKFLSAPQRDSWALLDVRVHPLYAERVERTARKYKMLRRDYIVLVVAYYIVHVLSVIKPRANPGVSPVTNPVTNPVAKPVAKPVASPETEQSPGAPLQ